MAQQLSEETLRRLLVAKHLLASNSGQLTPQSDATTVARMVLAAHDAAELAAAAIASHLNVPNLNARDQVYLMDYPARIAAAAGGAAFPGTDFLRRLNNARLGFKHFGNLPDPGSWHRVGSCEIGSPDP